MPNKLPRLALQALLWVLSIAAAIVLVRAINSLRGPELQPWHHPVLTREFRAADSGRVRSLADYLAVEDALFSELDATIRCDPAPGEPHQFNRFMRGNPSDPDTYQRNWNRTQELAPARPRGGVLLLHGLTDSPYSHRHLAELYHRHGFYVLNLRLPGHGTIPGALVATQWEDWLAAAQLGARHLRSQIAPGQPFHIVGYSNGGALAVKYLLDAAEDPTLPMPNRAILLSPMVGVSFFAHFSAWHKLLSWLPAFEKFRWMDILPEYDPFKYNSFPKAAGAESFELIQAMDSQLARLVDNGAIAQLPPVLTFQSLVDATVSTQALVDGLYRKLPAAGNELVLFDINHQSAVENFLQPGLDALARGLIGARDLPFAVTLVTNAGPQTGAMVTRSQAVFSDRVVETPLNLQWPRAVYSLSHVAIPFPPDDPLYGQLDFDQTAAYSNIGSLTPRGEKSILAVPLELLMRLRYNPFHAYMEQRIGELLPQP